jgi:hypothetical protein
MNVQLSNSCSHGMAHDHIISDFIAPFCNLNRLFKLQVVWMQ